MGVLSSVLVGLAALAGGVVNALAGRIQPTTLRRIVVTAGVIIAVIYLVH